jgi:hypothetical protein
MKSKVATVGFDVGKFSATLLRTCVYVRVNEPVSKNPRLNELFNVELYYKFRPYVDIVMYSHFIKVLIKAYTVGPRFTNNSFHEQIFRAKKSRMTNGSRITNTQASNSGKLRVSARE